MYLTHPIIVELLRYGYHTRWPASSLYFIPVTFVATIALTSAHQLSIPPGPPCRPLGAEGSCLNEGMAMKGFISCM